MSVILKVGAAEESSSNAPGPVVRNIRVLAAHPVLHLYHPDLSPDGRYVAYSSGPGGRVPANGPGTHTEVAEMVGVRGPWDIFVKRVSGDGPALRLTDAAPGTDKEPEWAPVHK